MQLRKATRRQAKLKIGVSASSGAGKTYSSLLIAKGLVGDWSKIAVIDTENGSADLYSHLGDYNVLTLTDFSPNSYIQAIKVCEKEGMECIIIDSISQEWDWCLRYHAKLGGKYQDWGQVTPLHDAFKNTILQSGCHIITSVRRKQEYSMDKEDGKTVVKKLGLGEVTREGWEYELTLNFEIDHPNHTATPSKDRTGLFVGQPSFIITEETGKMLKEWAETSSDSEAVLQTLIIDINNCNDEASLNKIYKMNTDFQNNENFLGALKNKKNQLKENSK